MKDENTNIMREKRGGRIPNNNDDEMNKNNNNNE
jgi:hypothetical protein